jgi:pimeloyl-ACP methyl ester carboxylesterase
MIPVSVERNTEAQLSDVGEEYSIDVLWSLQQRKILVTNSYNLSAVYCEPTGPSSTNTSGSTIQLLVHGATYSKIMWDFPYQPETYSWVRHAAARGYATLAVDQVGAGNSSFPNGLLEVQTQTYVETLHQVIGRLRNGTIAETGNRAFQKVVPIGFSLGAVTLISLADQYPEDGDAIVLHGVSWNAATLYPAFFAGFQVAAAQVDPAKWGHIPTSYTTQSTPRSREITCFYGDYDKGILPLDFELRDFDTLGASITIPSHTVYVGSYTGPVFLGNGDGTFDPPPLPNWKGKTLTKTHKTNRRCHVLRQEVWC